MNQYLWLGWSDYFLKIIIILQNGLVLIKTTWY